ncbi:MAG: cytochrome c3 family protein [Deferribacterales bacterium]
MGLFALTVYAGCAGDCYTCHPKLKGNKDHLVLGTCIQCHNPANQKILTFGSQAEGCGDNCFECHKEWPKDGNHAPMISCKDCHKKFEK